MKSSKPLLYRSSNEILRKNRERKIALENEIIVKKLIETKPFLMKKTLDEAYLEYRRRKRRLAKLSTKESITKSFDSSRLPGIQ
jgi:hypothetical protein